MKKILLLCAMPSEYAEIKKTIPFPECPYDDHYPILMKQANREVYLTITGIGKVNAAAASSAAITKLQPDCVIGLGVAGGIDPQVKIGDLVVSSSAQQYDVDATAFGYAHGIIPQMATSDFPADITLNKLAITISKALNLEAATIIGQLLSGDCFVTNTKGQEIRQLFGGTAVDMESAAWAQAAYLHEIPWIIIRSISDQADGKAHADYSEFLPMAMQNLAQLAQNLIEEVINHAEVC